MSDSNNPMTGEEVKCKHCGFSRKGHSKFKAKCLSLMGEPTFEWNGYRYVSTGWSGAVRIFEPVEVAG